MYSLKNQISMTLEIFYFLKNLTFFLTEGIMSSDLDKVDNCQQIVFRVYQFSRQLSDRIVCFLKFQNENFFSLHEQISNFLKGYDLLVTNRPKKNFPRM